MDGYIYFFDCYGGLELDAKLSSRWQALTFGCT